MPRMYIKYMAFPFDYQKIVHLSGTIVPAARLRLAEESKNRKWKSRPHGQKERKLTPPGGVFLFAGVLLTALGLKHFSAGPDSPAVPDEPKT